MFKADVTYREVVTPDDEMCANGHLAPKTFKRNGPESEPEPTKFFKVSGKNVPRGIYCEPCLIVANYIAKLKRE